MEILKDLVKEHPVVAGIALVAAIAINEMVEAERIAQKQTSGVRSRESATFYIDKQPEESL